MGGTASVCLSNVDDNNGVRVPEDPTSGQTAQQDQIHVEMVSKSENISESISFFMKSDSSYDSDSTCELKETKLDTSPVDSSVSDLERAMPTIDVEEFRAKVLDIPESSANEVHPSCVFLQAAEVARMQELRTKHSKRTTFNSSPEDIDSVLVSTPSSSLLPHTKSSILSQMQSPNPRRGKNVTSINTMDVSSSMVSRTGVSPPELARVSAQEKLYFDFPDNISEGNASIAESQATTVNNGMLGSPFSDNTSLQSLESHIRIYQAPNLEAGPHILSYYAPNENAALNTNALDHKNEPYENLSEFASPEMEERFFNNLRDLTDLQSRLRSGSSEPSQAHLLKGYDKKLDDKHPLQGQHQPLDFQDTTATFQKKENIRQECDTIEEDEPYEGKSSYSISGSNSSSSTKYESHIDSSVPRIKPDKKMTWKRYMKKATSAALRATFVKKRGTERMPSV